MDDVRTLRIGQRVRVRDRDLGSEYNARVLIVDAACNRIYACGEHRGASAMYYPAGMVLGAAFGEPHDPQLWERRHADSFRDDFVASRYPVTSVRVERVPDGEHERVTVFNRSASAGSLIVRAGDGATIAERLLPVEFGVWTTPKEIDVVGSRIDVVG